MFTEHLLFLGTFGFKPLLSKGLQKIKMQWDRCYNRGSTGCWADTLPTSPLSTPRIPSLPSACFAPIGSHLQPSLEVTFRFLEALCPPQAAKVPGSLRTSRGLKPMTGLPLRGTNSAVWLTRQSSLQDAAEAGALPKISPWCGYVPSPI